MALSFQKKVKTKIEIVVPYENLQADSAKVHIEEILNNTKLDELALIAKVCKNSTIKSLALSKAKSFL
jgi:hypothetical protein